MYVGQDFDAADPQESEVYSFDFVRDLAPGETIASAVWTCEVAPDSPVADAGAATRLVGPPGNDGQVTMQRVAGLVDGVKYVLQAVVTSSLGNQVSLWSNVTCDDPAP